MSCNGTLEDCFEKYREGENPTIFCNGTWYCNGRTSAGHRRFASPQRRFADAPTPSKNNTCTAHHATIIGYSRLGVHALCCVSIAYIATHEGSWVAGFRSCYSCGYNLRSRHTFSTSDATASTSTAARSGCAAAVVWPDTEEASECSAVKETPCRIPRAFA